MSDDYSITGRDSFIIARTLAGESALMPYLPSWLEAPSDRDDRLKSLFALSGDDSQHELDVAAATGPAGE
jgi:hypothetical protein